MVINKCGDRLYNGLVEKTSSHLATVAARIEAAQGDTFLSELRSCWDVHIKSMHNDQGHPHGALLGWDCLLLPNRCLRRHWHTALLATKLLMHCTSPAAQSHSIVAQSRSLAPRGS